jgi:hypothetical protein
VKPLEEKRKGYPEPWQIFTIKIKKKVQNTQNCVFLFFSLANQ